MRQEVRFRLQIELFVYKHIQDTIDDTFDEWSDKVREWDMHPLFTDKKLVAVVMVKEKEIHVVIDKRFKGKWYKRDRINAIFKDILDKYGEVVTSSTYGNDESMEFLKRIGFEPRVTICTLRELNHAR